MELIHTLTIWLCLAAAQCEPIDIDTGLSAVACATMADDLAEAGPYIRLGSDRVAYIPRVDCRPIGFEIGV